MQKIRIEMEVSLTTDDPMRPQALCTALWKAAESQGFPTGMKVYKEVVETAWHEQRLLNRRRAWRGG